MPSLPPDPSWADWTVQILSCGIFGGVGAALSCLRKRVYAYQMLIAVMTSSAISGTLPFALKAIRPETTWHICVPVSLFIGLIIFGIIIALEKTDTSVAKMDATDYIPGGNKKVEGPKP